MSQQTVKVWITKYWQTKGIYEADLVQVNMHLISQ